MQRFLLYSVSILAVVFTAVNLFAFRADDDSAVGNAPLPGVKITPRKIPVADQKKAAELLDGVTVEWDARTGVPFSIRGKDLAAKNLGGKGLALSTGAGRNFAADSVAVMDRLTRIYRLRDASAELKPFKTETDELGFHHVRINQMYQGLKVVGGQLIVHFNKAGEAYQVNGSYIPDISLETRPAIEADAAVVIAQADLARMGKPVGTLKGAVQLVVYAQDVAPVLAYELTIVYHDKKAGPGIWRYWVDANTGAIINRYNDIRKSDATISGTLNAGEGSGSVSVTGNQSGSYYYLYYATRHWEIYDYPDSTTARSRTATWGTSTSLRSEMSAAYNFDKVQSYYFNTHSRNSYNNAGSNAVANVHYQYSGQEYDNAFWDSDTKEFYFYPGSDWGELTVMDVCGHEFTHAVTENTAGFVYQYESGALDESFADIFGTIIEFASQPDGRGSYPDRTAGSADWLVGEDCTYTISVALRDMRNPQRYNNPSKYHGTCWYYGSTDNGGVHYNSGVQNHFFYLLCEGGNGTNDGISYNITGLGITNARAIAYRTLSAYCTSRTKYAAARTYWLSAARDLDLSGQWASTVQAAWAAVGVNSNTVASASALRAQGLNNDFDNDGKGDFALYNYQTGNWYIWLSKYSTWLANGINFGSYGYLPVPGDYDGNGYSDVCIYSPYTTMWFIYYTGIGNIFSSPWGSAYFIPATGDYDGDGKSDFALYNYVTGAWYILKSSTGKWLANGDVFGGSGYIPVPGDYNGGGMSDAVVYSRESALWLLYYPENGTTDYCDFSDVFRTYRYHVPAPGDYDGDSASDFSLYDYKRGYWYIWSPVGGWLAYGFQWGNEYYIPVPGDYDGDLISDLAVYSPYYKDWYIYYTGSGSSMHLTNFGGTDYRPVIYWALYWYM